MLNKGNLLSFLIVFFVGIIVGAGGVALAGRAQPTPIVIQPPVPTLPPGPTSTPGPLRIFVSGAVAAPAVYEMPHNGIVQEAIERAGGFTDEADTAVVNLALPLFEGMQIYVPTEAETAAQLPAVISEPVRSTGIELGSGGETAVDEPTGLVNINSADVAELDTLPGIGPSTAEKIVEYRETNGPFATIDEITSVSGIGPAKFEQIQPFITVGE
ncbi:MAG: helix-hairpin-helix domain-containing protein [Ardenticatenaceae bacterium]|nr:helix-hairpin-helix domain-containing protein [Anaerolineales bacterium]MCB8938233.1 helix-hairpin-helix domain-containing protein [Ardenticatenaceae bacterium]MCB8975743.1 helix-hairpin-helix domain-containing protein [Ardenticatenaceae bacterium]